MDKRTKIRLLNDSLCRLSEDEFLKTLHDIAILQGGIGKLARNTGLGRESLYKTLDQNSKPRFGTIKRILWGLGLEFKVSLERDPLMQVSIPLGGTVKKSRRAK